MKSVWIDFRQPTAPKQQGLRAALLIAGVLALGLALFRQHQVSAERTALIWQQQNLARLESRRMPMLHTSVTGDVSQETNKRANEVLRQLNTPWDRLFVALEHAVVPGIHVLSVAPDPRKSTVTLKALAPDTSQALDFIERLQDSTTLRNVHLVNQEIMVDNKGQPLLFTVSAEWSTAP